MPLAFHKDPSLASFCTSYSGYRLSLFTNEAMFHEIAFCSCSMRAYYPVPVGHSLVPVYQIRQTSPKRSALCKKPLSHANHSSWRVDPSGRLEASNLYFSPYFHVTVAWLSTPRYCCICSSSGYAVPAWWAPLSAANKHMVATFQSHTLWFPPVVVRCSASEPPSFFPGVFHLKPASNLFTKVWESFFRISII